MGDAELAGHLRSMAEFAWAATSGTYKVTLLQHAPFASAPASDVLYCRCSKKFAHTVNMYYQFGVYNPTSITCDSIAVLMARVRGVRAGHEKWLPDLTPSVCRRSRPHSFPDTLFRRVKCVSYIYLECVRQQLKQALRIKLPINYFFLHHDKVVYKIKMSKTDDVVCLIPNWVAPPPSP